MPEIGQEVVVIGRTYGKTHRIFGYRVKRVTPSGQIVVERNGDERRFCKAGKQLPRATTFRSNSWIEYNVAEQRRLHGAQTCRIQAVNLITQISALRFERESSTDRIQEVITEARRLLDNAQFELNDARKYEEETNNG